MEAQRLLIVNADEFGRSSGINRGIIEAHRQGIVTSASVMVRRPGAAEAAALSREHPGLSVGLQLDLCEWERRDGEWLLVESVVPLDDGDQVAEEILYQLAAFRALFSRDPTHIDSHQDVHRADPTRSLLLTVARKLGVPLRHFASEITVRWAFGDRGADGRTLAANVSATRLRRLLVELPPGCTELVCRPAVGSAGDGAWGRERERELEALCDPTVRRDIEERGIRRVSFHELGSRPSGKGGDHEPSLREQGRAAYDRRDFHQAAFWFRREAAVSPDRPWPWLWLSRAQLRTGDLVGSRMSVDRALEICPGWPPALLHLADLHLELDRDDAAAEVLERLAHTGEDGGCSSPVEGRIARGVARRVHRLRDTRAALRVAQALAGRYPDRESAVAAQAISLWRNGDPHEGVPAKPGPGRGNRAAAEIELELGNPRRAWNLIRTSPLAEEDRELVTRVGHALRRSGDLTGAWEALERTMALGATDSVIRHWREVVLGEVHVLSGVWAPSPPHVGPYDPFPTRVLHLVDRATPQARDEEAIRARDLTTAEKEAGLDPHMATRLGFPWDRSPAGRRRSVEIEGIPHHRIDPPGVDALPARLDQRLDREARELAALVRRVRPAVLHASPDYRNALLALAMKRACGVPVVYEVGDFPPELWRTRGAHDQDQPLARRWRLARELECMRAADRVVAPGESVKAALVERGVPERKIAVVPHAADPEAFQPGAPDRELARSLGLHPGEVVLGSVIGGGSREADGLELVVDAVARLVQDGQPVKGVFLGDGDGEEIRRVAAKARELGIEDRIAPIGPVKRDRLAAHYRLIDVFIETRRKEHDCPSAAPPELFQAMATGRAVVVSDVQSFRETVLPGVTGYVARPGDPEDLVAVLRPLVGSHELRAGMGRAARRWVMTNRTWRKNGERYAEIYRSLPMAPRRRTGERWRPDAAAAFRVGPPRARAASGPNGGDGGGAARPAPSPEGSPGLRRAAQGTRGKAGDPSSGGRA
jgi:predicted glycoside hydrolase/deacetylase ChbG (UPF0249 family)/glycosyltransferase involved in cell wall biosynthesis